MGDGASALFSSAVGGAGRGVEASSPVLPGGMLSVNQASPLGGAGLGWLLERKAKRVWRSQGQVFSSMCFLFCVDADAPDGPAPAGETKFHQPLPGTPADGGCGHSGFLKLFNLWV